MPAASPGRDAGRAVLDHETFARRNPKPLGGAQVGLRIGLAAVDVISRNGDQVRLEQSDRPKVGVEKGARRIRNQRLRRPSPAQPVEGGRGARAHLQVLRSREVGAGLRGDEFIIVRQSCKATPNTSERVGHGEADQFPLEVVGRLDPPASQGVDERPVVDLLAVHQRPIDYPKARP